MCRNSAAKKTTTAPHAPVVPMMNEMNAWRLHGGYTAVTRRLHGGYMADDERDERLARRRSRGGHAATVGPTGHM